MFFGNRKICNRLAALLIFGCVIPLYGQWICQAAAGGLLGGSGQASPIGGVESSLSLPKMHSLSEQDIDMSADSYEYVGSNLIARGHAVIRVKDMQITANSIVINLLSKDMEAAGNVVFSVRTSRDIVVTPDEYETYQMNPAVKIVANGITTSPDGNQAIRATVISNSAYLTAERASGSLESGAFQFRNFFIKAGVMYFRGELADRYPNGTLKLFKSKMTTCEYETDSNAHYDIASQVMTLKPREANRSIYNYNPDQGEHSLLAWSNIIHAWNFPVLWLPALYKPADSNSFGIRFEYGKDSTWGHYIRTAKEFEILEEPAVVRAGLLVDYYSYRGFGFGATGDVLTENSKTEFFAYYIKDRNPYRFWDSDRGDPEPGYTKSEWLRRYGRYELPSARYEIRLSNLTHLTPRLDFRGQLDAISDYNFLEDYFESRYDRDVQPPTFAALEYQGDRFSATLQTQVRINSFDTTMERLPELRLDFFRQELFKNIYYQGQTSAGYYRMRWRHYTYSRDENPNINFAGILQKEGRMDLYPEVLKYGNNTIGAARYLQMKDPQRFNPYFSDPEDYDSFRFDTLHGLYYPFQLFGFLNLIPRALARFTAYSKSPSEKVSVKDLYAIYSADQVDRWPSSMQRIVPYGSQGGSRYRLAFELGLEGNMKISRAWQTPKSALLRIDGLRHVMVPYFNLTYIPKPTVNYDQLYYFDDVDQIEKQAFIRLGVQNRLQTRRNNQLYEWISLENYWDFHFESTKDFNHIGDFGTILRFTPTEKLSFFTELLLDVGQNNKHDARVTRGSKDAGRPGLSSKFINRFNAGLSYQITKDWIFSASYYYSDSYAQRTTYSMGSTLAQINATTHFKSYFEREQYVTAALDFPTIIDKRLKGKIYASYDIDEDIVDDVGILLRRDFHCWYVTLGAGCYSERVERKHPSPEHPQKLKKRWPYYVNFTVGISAMPGLSYTASHEVKPTVR